MYYYKPILIALLLILSAGRLYATHYFGLDLYYTHLSGNTYRVTIVSWGDCSGAQFPSFSKTRPRIYIKDGNTTVFDDYLTLQPPKDGVEVTSGCPADLKRTTCVDPKGTVPGVKKFVYSKVFTLPHTSSSWLFYYLGETDDVVIAGRSNSLTNVSPPGTISLGATLDNTHKPNSSPQFSTVATQFYCINTPTIYDPGGSDADGDSLVYELVPGIVPGGTVTYVAGYSGSNPLAVTPGSFSFSGKTGELSFIPNLLQKSLVVYRVSEYRNGALIGSVMREMTMVVAPCINKAPEGFIADASGAKIIDSVTVKTCIGNHEVSFDINPTDVDRQNINMVVTDLPTGAKLDITGNNTIHPQSHFTWSMPDLPPGDYTFHITYTDDGCTPSQKTQAYTIRIEPDSIYAEAITASCTSLGLIKVTAPSDWVPWDYTIYKDIAPVYNMQYVLTASWSDSMAAGKYSINARNFLGCTSEVPVEVPTTCEVADIPTAFSPNGDGHNDLLYVRGMNIDDMHLRIYNRWGQLVFESHDMATGWDGWFNGQKAPTEAYAYVLSVVFKSGNTFQKKGNITLLR